MIGIVSADELLCDFHNTHFGYACKVSSLENEGNNVTITGLAGSGVDLSVNNVTFLIIYGTNANFIPAGLGGIFNLKTFQVSKSILKEINKDNFLGMESLLHLYLQHNQLSFVPIDSFKDLKKLEIISLGFNYLTELGNGIFLDNHSLKRIYLNNNRIKSLGSSLFHHLDNLMFVKLSDNVCVDGIYDNVEKIETVKEGLLNCNGLNQLEPKKLPQCVDEIKVIQMLTIRNANLMDEIKNLRQKLITPEHNLIL